jgi:hypothetical protein
MGEFLKYIRDQLRSREMWARYYQLNTPAYSKEERRAKGKIVLGKADLVPLTLLLLPLFLLMISLISFEINPGVFSVIGAALSMGLLVLIFAISAKRKEQTVPVKEGPGEKGESALGKYLPILPSIMAVCLFLFFRLKGFRPQTGISIGLLVMNLGFFIAYKMAHKRKKSKNIPAEKREPWAK